VVADVVFHQLSHQAVDGSSSGRQPLKDIRALFVIVKGAQGSFQLADDFFGAIDKVQFFLAMYVTFLLTTQ